MPAQASKPTSTNATGDDRVAASLRGFGPIGILVILAGNFVVAPLSAILVLLWVRLSCTPWPAIGYVRPESWVGSVVGGISLGVAFKLLMKTIVLPLLGADPINPAYHYLAGNTAALPGMILALIIVAGFGEETVFRGWMFERLGRLLGRARWAKVLTVLITSVWFGALHYPEQRLAGAQQAVIFGLVIGTIFAITRRIFMLMVAHAAFDLTALAIIYWDKETDVAHLFFK
ncbi:MAG: protease family protein [Verrucomicrobiota bacterium]|jgi:membrane protease YdiL (CAAX protease family)